MKKYKERFINWMIKVLKVDPGEISDGYHTFNELYDHRIILYLSLCRLILKTHFRTVWKNKYHSDGTQYPGWFLLGINMGEGYQMTYHIPMKYWNMINCVEFGIDDAVEFDGHTPKDVLSRMVRLIHEIDGEDLP